MPQNHRAHRQALFCQNSAPATVAIVVLAKAANHHSPGHERQAATGHLYVHSGYARTSSFFELVSYVYVLSGPSLAYWMRLLASNTKLKYLSPSPVNT